MYINNKTGCFAIGGSKDSGTYKEIGDKKTPVLEFSLAVGKDEDNNTKWVNCKAWQPVATRFKDRLIKGEKYLVSGGWEKREYNGKDYFTLVVDFLVGMPDFKNVLAETSVSQIELPDDDNLPF